MVRLLVTATLSVTALAYRARFAALLPLVPAD